jgi:carboxyl-terminal processing protease
MKLKIISSFTGLILFSLTVLTPFSSVKGQSDGFEVIKNLELIDLITRELDKFFVDKPIPGKLMKAAIDAMLLELDPYTVLINESNIEDYRLMSTGQYGGIGALLTNHKEYVAIAEVFENNPAFEAGVRAGDLIISVDGKSMKNKKSDDLSELLKGPKGTKVKVEVDRPFVGNKFFEITRSEVEVPDVPHHTIVREGIGYIKLTAFSQKAYNQVKSAYEDLEKKGMKSLILDLRGNGGGVLTEAVNIVNLFVPKGQEIVRTKGRIEEENRVYLTENAVKDLDIPIVVLVDAMSASASEIVAGSLQDLDRAVIVGSNTFGKGLVQRVMDLKYGSKLKLTISRYYTPSGRCVQRLDYSNRKEGEDVKAVEEAQVTYFQTKNGRKVRDARGVDPDVEIVEPPYSRLTAFLFLEQLIFDFATEFSHKNKSITTADAFQIDNTIFTAFKVFIADKKIEYKTESEEKLEAFILAAEKEKLLNKNDEDYKKMQKAVTASLERDLEKSKNELFDLLANEIVSRYYFQKGRVINSFRTDDVMKEAIAILENTTRYKKILSGI